MVQIKELSVSEINEYKEDILLLMQEALSHNFSDDCIPVSFCNEKFGELAGYMREQSATVFGAVTEGKIVGWLWCHKIDRFKNHYLHVAYFSVRPEYKHKGIGRLLIEAAERKAVAGNLEGIDLFVTASNDRAVGFYKHLGYEPERYLMIKTV